MTDAKAPVPPSRHVPGWPLLAVLGVGVVLLAAAWFAFGSSLTGSSDSGPPAYVEAVVGSPSHINPLFTHLNDVDRDLSSLVFSGLTRLGDDGSVQPDLAQSWDVSQDGKLITFHLRAGVTWHTGAPFTSDDVIFTYNLLKDPKLQGNPEQAALWRQISCAAPDKETVFCTLPDAYAPFLSYTTVGILPKHILDGATGESVFTDAFNSAPIGTGPYRLAQLSQTQAVLKANDRYYLGAPRMAEIDVRFHPDISSAAADVVRGNADGILMDQTASQADLDAISGVDGLKSYGADRSAYTILYLNNTQPPLNDEAVREAIAHTVDVDTIISKMLGGRGVAATSPMAPGTWAADAELEPIAHDVGKARDILDKAGWTLPGGGGVRQRNNLELRLSLMTDDDPLRGAVAQEISRELGQIGMEVSVVPQPATDLIRQFLLPRAYQAAVFTWDPGPDPDPYPAWHSSQAAGTGRNLAGYTNQDADKLMEDARKTTDQQKRTQLYKSFQEIFQQNIPSVLLYYPVYTYYVSDSIKGVRIGTFFSASSRFNNVTQWRIEKAAAIGDK